MILTKNYDYIEDKGDHYLISSLVVNDDLEIDLDKRLHVSTNLFVAGRLSTGITIVADGNIVIHGEAVAEGIQANIISIMGKVLIKNNVMAKGTIQIWSGTIGGSVISNEKITFIGNVVVSGDISGRDIIVAKSNLSVSGDLSAGSLLDVSGDFVCDGEARVLGKEIKSYGRLNGNEYTLIVADDILLMVKSNTVTTAIDSMDEYQNEISLKDKANISDKEYEFYSRRDWIRNIITPIRKIPEVENL